MADISKVKIGSTTYNIKDSNAVSKSGDTITGTLILSRTADASGTANNKPALIVGGTDTTPHIEVDTNEIMAKSDGTHTTNLYLNNEGGTVHTGGDFEIARHVTLAYDSTNQCLNFNFA